MLWFKRSSGTIERFPDDFMFKSNHEETANLKSQFVIFNDASAEAIRSTVYLDPEMHQALRLKSARSRSSMVDIVNDALRQALRGDQEDLAAVRSRSTEKALGYEEFLAKPISRPSLRNRQRPWPNA